MKKNRILLCHRTDRDLWNLPGGGLERGETPWQGVIREVKEEVGLKVYYSPDSLGIEFNENTERR